jgi:hypothetical protein
MSSLSQTALAELVKEAVKTNVRYAAKNEYAVPDDYGDLADVAQESGAHESGRTANFDIAAIEDLLESGKFGCYREAVADLVSLVTGEKISAKTEGALPRGCVVVPIAKEARNGYPLNVPCVVVGKGKAYMMNGKIGFNALPSYTRETGSGEVVDNLRLASKAEIETLFTSIIRSDRQGKLILLYT